MNNAAWLDQRIEYIRGLSKPTQQQELLLLINNKSNKTPVDDRKLTALVKAERAEERAQNAKADVKRLLDEEKQKARKEETRQKVILGGLLMSKARNNAKTRQWLLQAIETEITRAADKKTLAPLMAELQQANPSIADESTTEAAVGTTDDKGNASISSRH